MIIREKDFKREERENVRDGKGKIIFNHFLTAEQAYNKGTMFSVSDIPPGSSIGTHSHVGNFEIYYIVEGPVDVLDNGTPATLQTGDVMICRDGDNHAIANTTQKNARVMFVIINTK